MEVSSPEVDKITLHNFFDANSALIGSDMTLSVWLFIIVNIKSDLHSSLFMIGRYGKYSPLRQVLAAHEC